MAIALAQQLQPARTSASASARRRQHARCSRGRPASHLFVCSKQQSAPYAQSVYASRAGELAEYRVTWAPFKPLLYIAVCILATAIYKAFANAKRDEQPSAQPSAPVRSEPALIERGTSSPLDDENAVKDVASRVLGGGSSSRSSMAPPAEGNTGRIVICAQLPKQQQDERQVQQQYTSALASFSPAVQAASRPSGFILVYPR
jgi:hypothetical protein